MSGAAGQRAKLSEEARFELSLTAMNRERRNRPRAALALAVAVLAASAVFMLYAVSARASARKNLALALADQAASEARIAEWKELVEAEAATPQGAVGRPGEFKVSKMEDLAARVGMKAKPNPPTPREDKSRPGITVYQHVYTEVRDPSLAALVDWVRLACVEIGGLEVESMAIRPEPAGWKMDVTFRRWERSGS